MEDTMLDPQTVRQLRANASTGPWRIAGDSIVDSEGWGIVNGQDEQDGPSWAKDQDAELIAAAPAMADTVIALDEAVQAALKLHEGDHWCTAGHATDHDKLVFYTMDGGGCPTGAVLGDFAD